MSSSKRGWLRRDPAAHATPSQHHDAGESRGDRFGEELAEGARIWTMYAAEARKYDDGMLKEWNSSIDTLLIFVCRSAPPAVSCSPLLCYVGWALLRSLHRVHRRVL